MPAEVVAVSRCKHHDINRLGGPKSDHQEEMLIQVL